MSAWRILVKNLYNIGGTGVRSQFDDLGSYSNSATGLVMAQRLGLMTREGKRQGTVWRITALGRAFVEGRAEVKPSVGARTGGRAPMRVAACWLSPLCEAIEQ